MVVSNQEIRPEAIGGRTYAALKQELWNTVQLQCELVAELRVMADGGSINNPNFGDRVQRALEDPALLDHVTQVIIPSSRLRERHLNA